MGWLLVKLEVASRLQPNSLMKQLLKIKKQLNVFSAMLHLMHDIKIVFLTEQFHQERQTYPISNGHRQTVALESSRLGLDSDYVAKNTSGLILKITSHKELLNEFTQVQCTSNPKRTFFLKENLGNFYNYMLFYRF